MWIDHVTHLLRTRFSSTSDINDYFKRNEYACKSTHCPGKCSGRKYHRNLDSDHSNTFGYSTRWPCSAASNCLTRIIFTVNL